MTSAAMAMVRVSMVVSESGGVVRSVSAGTPRGLSHSDGPGTHLHKSARASM